jgi:tetratricopeptide (TPR) repeat protein
VFVPTGEELRQQAMTAVRSGNFKGARATLRRARRLAIDDPDTAARIVVSDAYVEAELNGTEAGIRMCAEVTELTGLDPVTVGTAWSQLGLLHMRRGDPASALEAFSTAIPMLAEDAELVGRAYLNRGIVHLDGKDPRAAVEDLTRARDHLRETGLRETMGKADHNLGYAHLLLGDLITALEQMDRAIEAMSPLTDVMRSILEQDRAEVLLAAGRTELAIAALEAAAGAYGAQRLRRFQAEAEFVLARTLLHGDPARARAVARQAARRFRAHDSPVWATRSEALATIAEISGGAHSASLRTRADELIRELRREGHHRDAEVLALHTARLAVRRGELDDARARAQRIRIADDTPITTRLLDREVRAELTRARGQTGRALAHVRSGLDDLHAWQSSFGSLDLQSTVVGHGNHLARLGLRFALASDDPAILFEWSERARALASRVTSLRPPPDPALATALTELRMADPKDTAAVRELKERIRSGSWFSASGTVGEPVLLGELQARLAADDSALVAHIVVDDSITALTVTPTGTTVTGLGPAMPVRGLLDRVAADLDFAAQHRAGDFAAAVRASLRSDLQRLSELLVEPLRDAIGEHRLVLTPSALLSGTPWSCLPGMTGRPLTIPTSATRWLEQTRQPIVPPRIAGFVAGPRLQRAEDEVHRAAATWPTAQVLTGEQADAARVGWLASRVDLFHVAGHGLHPGDHPLFSAVELADGPWFGHDVDLLPRTPDLVVLSACDLGRVSVVHGEESVGMSAAWLHAGARTVISSPALLADELACEVFAAWHRLVADGVAPADALARVGAETDDIVPLLSFGAGW